MIDLWPHWFRPWWLLLLPLLGWLLWQLWHRQKRAGRWQMILPPAFHAVLLSGGSGAKAAAVGRPRHGLAIAVWLLGPSWQRSNSPARNPPTRWWCCWN
jgi:Ca-activated chloride channel family protein